MDGAGCRALHTAALPARPSWSPGQSCAPAACDPPATAAMPGGASHTQPRPGRPPPDLPGRRLRSPGGVPALPAGSRSCCRLHGRLRDKGRQPPHAARPRAPRPSNGTAQLMRPRQARRPLPLPSWGSEPSASAPSMVRVPRRASRACASPLPALQALSPALPAFTSTPPRAQGERARIPSAAAYKGLGRTTPRRGRVVPLLHRRGCAEASISCRVGREGARAAEPRGSLKARPQKPGPKSRL